MTTSHVPAAGVSKPFGQTLVPTALAYRLGELCRAIRLCFDAEEIADAGFLIQLAEEVSDAICKSLGEIPECELGDRAYQLRSLCRAIGLYAGEERYIAAGDLVLFAADVADDLGDDIGKAFPPVAFHGVAV